MALYDCFTFFNELDLLELRLEELYDCFDFFVIVEATQTHSGKPKPLYFEENKQRYRPFLSKIKHVVVDDMPSPNGPRGRWGLENHQRRQIARGLESCDDEDIVFISDLDEIPNRDALPQVNRALESSVLVSGLKFLRVRRWYWGGQVVGLWQRLYFYYLNGFVREHWLGTRVLRAATLRRSFSSDVQRVRRCALVRYVEDGGWHFSYLGGAEAIAAKIHAFAHAECDTADQTDLSRIQGYLEDGVDLWTPSAEVTYVQMDESFPRALRVERGKYSHLIRQVDKGGPR